MYRILSFIAIIDYYSCLHYYSQYLINIMQCPISSCIVLYHLYSFTFLYSSCYCVAQDMFSSIWFTNSNSYHIFHRNQITHHPWSADKPLCIMSASPPPSSSTSPPSLAPPHTLTHTLTLPPALAHLSHYSLPSICPSVHLHIQIQVKGAPRPS